MILHESSESFAYNTNTSMGYCKVPCAWICRTQINQNGKSFYRSLGLCLMPCVLVPMFRGLFKAYRQLLKVPEMKNKYIL